MWTAAISILVVAEGAVSRDDADTIETLLEEKRNAKDKSARKKASEKLGAFHDAHVGHSFELTRQLESLAGQESRLTILGHLQRGGTPSAADRVLATRLGTRCAQALNERLYGVLLAMQSGEVRPVPLEEVAGKKKLVPPDHPLVESARRVGTSFGDE